MDTLRIGSGATVSAPTVSRKKAGRLEVYLSDVHCGHLVPHQDKGGEDVGGSQLAGMSFTYEPDFLQNYPNRHLSLSLPPQKESFSAVATRPFFRGLLPEAARRETFEQKLRLPPGDDFALLTEIGGDCPGAVSIVLEGAVPDLHTNETEEIDEKKLLDALRSDVPAQPKAEKAKRRLSIAGAQAKDSITFAAGDDMRTGKILLPKGERASTHIIKPALSADFPGIAFNEHYVMEIARKMGLPIPTSTLREVDGVTCYIVERFDRIRAENGEVRRRHQEDFCQASALIDKYEESGGPGFASCAAILNGLSVPARAMPSFIRSIIFNFLVGNADAHGKNYSLFHDDDGTRTLTPFYDLISTTRYPDVSTEMAMAWGSGTFEPRKVTAESIEDLAYNGLGIRPSRLLHELKDMSSRIINAAQEVRATLPQDYRASAKPILDIIKRRVQFLSNLLGWNMNIEVDAASAPGAWI